MKDNLHLKRGLITQALSPVFVLLVIRHMHFNHIVLVSRFFNAVTFDIINTIYKTLKHPEFGDLLIVIIGIVWFTASILSVPAFGESQKSGFESHGEQVVAVEEKKDAAGSFLMTFILPLLIDELSSPQFWISYILVIVVVYAVLYQSNLYYQSPVLALLGYKVFVFEVKNPCEQVGMKKNKRYIGLTKGKMISEGPAIIWKHIADDVFLVYNE